MKLREKLNALDEKIKQHKTVRIVRIVVLILLYIAIFGTAYNEETALLKGKFIKVVNGDSMNDTLHDKQRVFVLHQTPDYDDFVCFMNPSEDPESDEQTEVIKRLIGKPGDTVEIQSEGIILLNGQAIEQSYLSGEALASTYMKGGYNNVTLGDDEYFILGDNRANSKDSRIYGPVNESYYLHTATTKINQQTIVCLAIIVIIVLCVLFAFHVVDKISMFIAYAVACIIEKRGRRRIEDSSETDESAENEQSPEVEQTPIQNRPLR